MQTGQNTPINLLVEERFHRAAPGGMGGTKAVGNYSPVLLTQIEAKKDGYADVVYLDAVTDTYIEEVSSCNIFVVRGKTLRTPALTVRAGKHACICCAAADLVAACCIDKPAHSVTCFASAVMASSTCF